MNRIESLESLESRGKSGESRGNLARAKQKKENPNSYAIFLFFCGRAGEWTPPPIKKKNQPPEYLELPSSQAEGFRVPIGQNPLDGVESL